MRVDNFTLGKTLGFNDKYQTIEDVRMNVITAMQRSRDKFRNAYRELADTPSEAPRYILKHKPGCRKYYEGIHCECFNAGHDPRNHVGIRSMRAKT